MRIVEWSLHHAAAPTLASLPDQRRLPTSGQSYRLRNRVTNSFRRLSTILFRATWAGRIEVLTSPDLLGILNHFRGQQVLAPPQPAGLMESPPSPDLSDIRGLEAAKRALEISAAGSHNLLLIGPPGAGKFMLASCLPSLLPDLTPAEALEVSMVHSMAGLLQGGRLVIRPPFRDPHHRATQAALSGGGCDFYLKTLLNTKPTYRAQTCERMA